jgi:CopG family transcriptional regulator/antitoxin EndoAI
MRLYLEERRKRDLRERMKKGYQEMARINLALAEEALFLDHESLDLAQKGSESDE